MKTKFWQQPLATLNVEEWERLCDGCGQCCLHKLQDDQTEEIFATDVVCRFLDCSNGQCGVYAQRTIKKPDCFVITRDNAEHYSWLPKTCAYRLRYEDKPLKSWHPLISGSRDKMIAAGIAIDNWCVNENEVDEAQMQDHIVFSISNIK